LPGWGDEGTKAMNGVRCAKASLDDTLIGGQMRKVVSHFARNGFYYTLDRTNGKFIKATQYLRSAHAPPGTAASRTSSQPVAISYGAQPLGV
jgi:glucose dehydrogenase